MDSANERRVFNLIVDTVNKDNTSQYFMLTPKVLLTVEPPLYSELARGDLSNCL